MIIAPGSSHDCLYDEREAISLRFCHGGGRGFAVTTSPFGRFGNTIAAGAGRETYATQSIIRHADDCYRRAS
jgi:hypothetical protein